LLLRLSLEQHSIWQSKINFIFSLSLRSEEYDLLEKVYGLPEENDRINYKALIEEVETVFTVKGLEKDPLLRPGVFKMPDFLDPQQRLSENDNSFLHEVMIKLAILMQKYRVLPKVYFKDAVNYYLTFRIELKSE
jgi:hypothetical protein